MGSQNTLLVESLFFVFRRPFALELVGIQRTAAFPKMDLGQVNVAVTGLGADAHVGGERIHPRIAEQPIKENLSFRRMRPPGEQARTLNYVGR